MKRSLGLEKQGGRAKSRDDRCLRHKDEVSQRKQGTKLSIRASRIRKQNYAEQRRLNAGCPGLSLAITSRSACTAEQSSDKKGTNDVRIVLKQICGKHGFVQLAGLTVQEIRWTLQIIGPSCLGKQCNTASLQALDPREPPWQKGGTTSCDRPTNLVCAVVDFGRLGNGVRVANASVPERSSD